MNNLLRRIKLIRLCLRWDKIIRNELTKQDKENLAAIYVDPKYESQQKLINNLIIDLENKGFKEAEKMEELLAIKWTRQLMKLITYESKYQYHLTIKKNAKSTGEKTTRPESFEDLPDGVPLK